jgi:large subunit ribosomal protein L7/L12
MSEETTTPEVVVETTEETAAPEVVAEVVKEEAPVVEEAGEEVEVPAEFAALIEQVENMTVLELHKLVKVLEKKFGVSAAAVAVAGGAAAGAAEEQSSFDVILVSDGGSKIPVMKVVKTILDLGLKEAKELVESAPADIKKGVSKEEAETIKTQIEEAGGKVEIK